MDKQDFLFLQILSTYRASMARKQSDAPIDISIKNKLNIDIDHLPHRVNKNWNAKTQADLLAWDLATALHDQKGLAFYLSCVKRYPDGLLREILYDVLKIPDHKIKKSRGALFNYLVQKLDDEGANFGP